MNINKRPNKSYYCVKGQTEQAVLSCILKVERPFAVSTDKGNTFHCCVTCYCKSSLSSRF